MALDPVNQQNPTSRWSLLIGYQQIGLFMIRAKLRSEFSLSFWHLAAIDIRKCYLLLIIWFNKYYGSHLKF